MFDGYPWEELIWGREGVGAGIGKSGGTGNSGEDAMYEKRIKVKKKSRSRKIKD